MSSRPPSRWMLPLLFSVAAATYLIGNDRVGLWDRDEPRYAECSREMLQTGDWLIPRYLGNLRTEKPPLIYWCQATVMKVLGDTPAAARLPSALAILLTAAALAAGVSRAAGPQRGALTALVFCSSALVIASAKMCMTDALLLLWITIGQLCLYAIYQGNRSWRIVISLWVAIALAGLTKGPIALGVPLMTMGALAVLDAFERRRDGGCGPRPAAWWRRTRPFFGLLILFTVAGPWVIWAWRVNPEFMHGLLRIFGKHVGTSMEGHTGPIGYYLMTVWATFFPWSLLLPPAIIIGWRNRRLPQVRFALAALIGPWIMVELLRTKLPHYFLPVYPALSFLVADMLVRCARGQYDELTKKSSVIITGGWAILVACLGLAPWAAVWWFKDAAGSKIIIAGCSVLAIDYAILVFLNFRARRVLLGASVMGLGMLAVMAMLYGGFLPGADFLRLSPRVAAAMREQGATGKGSAIMIDYKEPSLAFYQGGTIREEERSAYLSVVPEAQWPTWIVLTREVWDHTPAEFRARLEVRGTFQGMNYADHGRIVEVMLVKKRNAR